MIGRETLRRQFGGRTGIALALAVGALVAAPVAQAGNIYYIQTVAGGGGSWIVNKPSGYYIGRAVSGSIFDVEQTTSGNWHYGRAYDNVNMCGWVEPGSMGNFYGSTSNSCSTTTQDMLSHRLNIGRDYNAPAHQAVDGTAVGANACTFYYNYFYGTSFAGGANGGHWANAAGTMTAGYVLYRFTTLDGGAVVARDPNLGWGFAPAGCVGRPATVYNDND